MSLYRLFYHFVWTNKHRLPLITPVFTQALKYRAKPTKPRWGWGPMPLYRLFYHFVWTTKHRLPLITPANQEPIYGSIRAKTQELNGIVHALNSMPDHVHLVVTVPPTIGLAEFMRQIKGTSSHLASHLPNAHDPFAWQSEYGVLSLSESHLQTVVRYVEFQQQHHADQTLDQRLEVC